MSQLIDILKRLTLRLTPLNYYQTQLNSVVIGTLCSVHWNELIDSW